MLTVRVETPILPSEDPKKVDAAARSLFPDLEATVTGGQLVGRARSLSHFEKCIHRQRILDTARGQMLRSVDGSGRRATFRLSKQAAAAGRVNFALDDAPLGDLVVTLEDERLEDLIRTIAPRTHKGFPVSEEEAERLEARRRLRPGAARPGRPAAGEEE